MIDETIKAKFKYIDNINFDKLIDRLTKEELSTITDPLIDIELAKTFVYKYKLFLKLMLLYPNKLLTPSVGIDIIWHYHILDTQQYTNDCMYLYGYYIHHIPSYTAQKFANTGTDEKIITIVEMDDLFKNNFNVSIHTNYLDSTF